MSVFCRRHWAGRTGFIAASSSSMIFSNAAAGWAPLRTMPLTKAGVHPSRRGPSDVLEWRQMIGIKARDSVRPTQTRRVRVNKGELPCMTGKDLLESGLIGIWKKRRDIRSSTAFARRLRVRASQRISA